MRATVIAALVALAGCGKKDEPEPPPPPRHEAPPAPAIDAFVPAFDERAIEVAPIQDEAAPPPARSAAALPRTAAEVKAFVGGDARFPPIDAIRDGLCRFATPAVLDAVDAALADPKLVKAWGAVVGACGGPPLCASAGPIVRGPARPVQALLKPVFDAACPQVKADVDEQRIWDTTVERLRAAGMLGPEPVAIPMQPHSESQPFELMPLEVLIAAGRADSIDTEGDGRSHAIPLRRIAYLVRPALDGAIFDEVRDAGGITLEAYLDGRRYTTPAKDGAGWFDLDAAIGLVNAILEARQSPMRVLALAGGGQVFDMAAGPREALHAAVRAGLLQAYDGGG